MEREGLIRIEGWVGKGLSDEQVAKNMGIAYSTFNVWKDKYSTLSEVLKKTKEVVDLEVQNSLHKRAIGYKEVVNKVKVLNSGEIIKYQEEVVYPPDTTAGIFWLKNRMRNEWTNGRTSLDIQEQEARIAKLDAQTGVIDGLGSDIEDMNDLRKVLLSND